MDPPSLRIGQYWDDEAVPEYLEGLFATFRYRNPEFDHRVFSKAETERLIGERFGDRELAAFRACAVPSMQSDYFRYCFALAHGGIYADVDYRCLRPLRPLLEGDARGEIFLGPSEYELNGREARRVWSGFFAFKEPGHPFFELALEIATANIEARIAERVWPVGENVKPAIWVTVGPGVPTLMRFIHEWGSFDAFLAGIAGSPVEPFGELYCETIGEYERIVEAFDGVRVSSFERMASWVADPDSALPYKQTDAHWHNVTTGIFTPRPGRRPG